MITTVDYHKDDDLYYLQVGHDQFSTTLYWMTEDDLELLVTQINDAVDGAWDGLGYAVPA